MNRLRLILVTSRYWPHSGDLESVAASIADGLRQMDVQVTVLTGSWGSDWPRSLGVRDIPIIRVPHAPRGGWNTFRYSIALGRWLRQHRHEFDLVYVLNLRYEAHAVIGAMRGTETPVVLRCQDSGTTGDLSWQARTRFGSRIHHACQHAHGIVAPNTLIADELAKVGYARNRLQVIPLGVALGESRSADRQFRARLALSDANHEFSTAEYAPVAVVAGRLDDQPGLSSLLNGWREVAARWPSARLWLIGEGSARDQLAAQIADLDLRYQILLPGTFEDLCDIFQAVDAFIWPTPHGGRQTILEAMAAGLPVVVADSPDLRGMMEHAEHGLLVSSRSPQAWTAAISRLFDAPQFAGQLGTAAAKLATSHFSRRRMAEAHCDLFARYLLRRTS